MTFLAPGFFLASLAVAAAVVALHFIVTRQPRAGILPTARFVPDLPANATARATRPSDLLLMLLRVLLVLAAGAGLAKPVVKPSRGADARVILMDLSRSVSDSSALRDSVRALYRNHDALIVFDSTARSAGVNASDSIAKARFTRARGNISAALISAIREAGKLRDRADSMELVIASPFAAEEFDAATDSIRSLWGGRARLVTVRGNRVSSGEIDKPLEIRGAAPDPLGITVSLARAKFNASGVIVRSGTLDSSVVEGSATISWPASGRPLRAVSKPVRDTIGGVISGDELVVSAFERMWVYPADSIRDAEIIARWIDGEPAAIEIPGENNCMRSVSIPVSPIGDLAIREDFVRLVAALSGDCALRRAVEPATNESVARLAGTGALASRNAFRPRGDLRSELAPLLIGLAIVLAIAELFVRRRRSAEIGKINRPAATEKRAA
jgi:hypothetical protein